MRKAFFIVLAMTIIAGVFATAREASESQLRERSNDVQIVGAFGGLLTSPFQLSSPELPDVDTLGPAIVAAEAAVWDTDAVTGAQYRRGELLVQFAADLPP